MRASTSLKGGSMNGEARGMGTRQTPEALTKDIKNGLYLTETFGMGINMTTGDYSQGAAGFWIENGEIAYPVSEITIAGHLRDMFKNITPANDLTFRYATNARQLLAHDHEARLPASPPAANPANPR